MESQQGAVVGRVTLQNVASAAGVSLKTASRVVNGERYVAVATAERVRRAISDLGFRPDQSARNLARGRRFRIAGLLITTLANPHVVALAHGVEQVLRREGYSLIIASTDEDPEVERQLLEEFSERGVESLVLVPSGDSHDHLTEAAQRMSIVLAHRVLDGLHADSVAPDDRGASRAAVQELLEAGHRRIAFLGDLGFIYNIQQRYEGFLEAHSAAGVPVCESLIVFDSRSAESAAERVTALLNTEQPPTAIFASNNLNCLGTLVALREASGRRGSGGAAGVDVIGFDALPEAKYMDVPVTLLSYDQDELGQRAASLLVERAAGRHHEPQHVIVPVTAQRAGFTS